jgi:hypothetical protein
MALDELMVYSNITKISLPLTKLGEIKLESLVKRFSFDPESIYANMKNTTLLEVLLVLIFRLFISTKIISNNSSSED